MSIMDRTFSDFEDVMESDAVDKFDEYQRV